MSLLTNKRNPQQVDDELDKIQPIAGRANEAYDRANVAIVDTTDAFALASGRIDAVSDEVKQLQRALAGISFTLFGDAEPMDPGTGPMPPGKGWTDYVNAELRSLDNTLDDHNTILEKIKKSLEIVLAGDAIMDIRNIRIATQAYVDQAIQRLSNALRDEWSRVHIKPGIIEAARKRAIAILGGHS